MLRWPQKLSACFEHGRKLFPCLKFIDDSLVIQPTALPSLKQPVAQQVQKLPTNRYYFMIKRELQ
jgi:hypothetical protein